MRERIEESASSVMKMQLMTCTSRAENRSCKLKHGKEEKDFLLHSLQQINELLMPSSRLCEVPSTRDQISCITCGHVGEGNPSSTPTPDSAWHPLSPRKLPDVFGDQALQSVGQLVAGPMSARRFLVRDRFLNPNLIKDSLFRPFGIFICHSFI